MTAPTSPSLATHGSDRLFELSSRRLSSNPLRRAFWIGEVDARVPALLRIVLGVILLSDVFDRLGDLFTFFTDLGAVPRGGSPVSHHWSVFALTGQPAPVAALFLLGVPI